MCSWVRSSNFDFWRVSGVGRGEEVGGIGILDGKPGYGHGIDSAEIIAWGC